MTLRDPSFGATRAAKQCSGGGSRLSCLTCCCAHNLTCTRHPSNASLRLKPCHKSRVIAHLRVLHGSGAAVATQQQQQQSSSQQSTLRTAMSAAEVAALTQQVQQLTQWTAELQQRLQAVTAAAQPQQNQNVDLKSSKGSVKGQQKTWTWR